MKWQILIVFIPLIVNGLCMEDVESNDFINSTNPDKDLYVIHATVYQVGILTNKTDNMTDGFNSTANQESVTFYHTNGSNIDLSGISEPLWTNVTAQSMVGVAPVEPGQNVTTLGELAKANLLSNGNNATGTDINSDHMAKRSINDVIFRLFKRDTGSIPVRTVNGTALIPAEAGVQSIALPPLLLLNNNLSNIPVPIPNTSVVHYAKVNTFIQKPGDSS